MEQTVYNPQKGRLETIEVEFTSENTTWFDHCQSPKSVFRITDIDGCCLLIQTYSREYPTLLYEVTRTSINFSQSKARKLLENLSS